MCKGNSEPNNSNGTRVLGVIHSMKDLILGMQSKYAVGSF
jgi:hypothetical protein